ncbi:helix-turn-helix domain-containing protein [Chryseobacterium sp. NRRL B-14798]|uniref:helix-turn-helix domain-containing protein n=1 Tax=Chryseobacterium sp. NRRL B-14798 TaxID=3162880 RepID=UPI003D1F1B67
MYRKTDLDTHLLLKWSKLLEYDFFRLYTQHLILYSPASTVKHKESLGKVSLPKFRKNIYTKEIIDFILQQIDSGEMTKSQTIEKYKIPRGTLYQWIKKYGK